MSENEATGDPDLEAVVATMPFAAALGVVLDAAGADEVRGGLPGRRNAARPPGRCTAAP